MPRLGSTLAEPHALFLERFLEEPQRFRPDAVQLLQLSDWDVRELAETVYPAAVSARVVGALCSREGLHPVRSCGGWYWAGPQPGAAISP